MVLREIELGCQDVSIASEPLDELVVLHQVGLPRMWRIKNQTLCLNWRHSIFALSSWEKLRLCGYVK